MARIEIATLVRRFRQLEEDIEVLQEQLPELVHHLLDMDGLKLFQA